MSSRVLLLFKKIKAYLALYPLLCNIVLPTMLLLMNNTDNNFYAVYNLFFIYLNGVLIYLLLRLFAFCRIYKLSMIIPLIWSTLFVTTNIELNKTIVLIVIIVSYGLAILLVCKWLSNSKKVYKESYKEGIGSSDKLSPI